MRLWRVYKPHTDSIHDWAGVTSREHVTELTPSQLMRTWIKTGCYNHPPSKNCPQTKNMENTHNIFQPPCFAKIQRGWLLKPPSKWVEISFVLKIKLRGTPCHFELKPSRQNPRLPGPNGSNWITMAILALSYPDAGWRVIDKSSFLHSST